MSCLCTSCGYPVEGKGYHLGPISDPRHICGFCWVNPTWPWSDPQYRDRQLGKRQSGETTHKRNLVH